MARPLSQFLQALTPPPKPPTAKKPHSGPRKAKNVIPAALRGSHKLEEADYKLLRRFMTGHAHDTVHLASQTVRALQSATILLDALNEKDTRMVTSGLMGDDVEALKETIERQDNVRAAIRGCLREVSAMRTARLQELVKMEATLEREERRQRMAAQDKIKKAKAAKTAEVRFEGSDEPGTPTVQIDPTLLAQATQTLRSDPDGINAKAAGDSGNRITKRTVGKVKHAKG